MIEFEILDGMPPYGPCPEQFSATSWGTHSEGFVLRVNPDLAEPWIGNFQPGLTGYSCAYHHPNGRDLVVVAGGQAYVVEPASRRTTETFGGALCWSHELPGHELLLFHNGLEFIAYGILGRVWRSRRVSWDGIRVTSVEFPWLRGEATGLKDQEAFFLVDLRSGEASGGSYEVIT